MSYRITGLPLESFAPLFALSDAELAARGARRVVADTRPGFPCRITLEDAEPGERLILLAFEHQPTASPYRSAGPIFVRESATAAFDRRDAIPEVLHTRLLSVRAYDDADMMVDAEVVDGAEIEPLIIRLFDNPEIAYLHIHNARRGCYAAKAVRA